MKRLLIVAVLLTAVSQAVANQHQEHIVCPTGQHLVVGANHVVSCLNNGMLGSSMNTHGGIQRLPGSNGGGVQSKASIRKGCLRQGLRYVGNKNGGYCVRSGLLG